MFLRHGSCNFQYMLLLCTHAGTQSGPTPCRNAQLWERSKPTHQRDPFRPRNGRCSHGSRIRIKEALPGGSKHLPGQENSSESRILEAGFRAARSTSQPIHIIRTIMDFHEAAGEHLLAMLLDWEKAFDKVDQMKLLEALTRRSIHEKFIAAISSLYDNSRFRSTVTLGNSDWQKQSSGIRHGCPLSPLLFICLMTVLFHDVYEDTSEG